MPKVIWASIMGVSLAMTKLKSHCVIKEAAMTRERTVKGHRALAGLTDAVEAGRKYKREEREDVIGWYGPWLGEHSDARMKGIGPQPNE